MLLIKKNTYLLVLLMLMSGKSFCQQQPLYSQFTFNKYLFNPAYAGSEQVTSIKLTGYEQWVGFSGAPKFHAISFDGRIFLDTKKPRRNVRKKFKLIKPGSVGGGATIFNEKAGPLSHTGIAATYSYHIKIDKQQLSLGISPVLSNLSLKSSDLEPATNTYDPLLQGGRWIMDFNFGAYFLAKDYYAGYSVHHLTGSVMQWGGGGNLNYRLRRQHYFMGGYIYSVTRDFDLEPSTLIKIKEGSKIELDLVLQGTIKRIYWCGLSYKTTHAISVFGGLNYDRYFFTYAFDYNISKISRYSYGSHEIMLAVQLGEVSKRYRWLNTY